MLTMNLAVFLVFLVIVRLRRRTQARSRRDETLTVVIVLALGVLLAPTSLGQGVLSIVGSLAHAVSQNFHSL
ncbi:hypothetical protein [Streptomyces sp. ICBB 8177]|uniref:hypothetical protein n=1 Tax=Streptomyces sp. ICBB 8177 TaxID=563922 RepID=UPI000D67AD78|nr:hypothetical protein [Streptomyces sp. ICBB 8177]PWI45373.1 hypothetical protein CK485_04345 [Streptomyces sp. ICBB 8177]